MRILVSGCWVAALLLVAAAACAQSGEAPKKIIAINRPETKTEGKLKVESPAFKEGQPMPDKYAGAGQNVSPPLKWSGVPKGAKTLALLAEDPDAPRPVIIVHWVLFNIPATTATLAEDQPKKEKLATPAGAIQGRNFGRQFGYMGPRPPAGNPPHHYHFQLFALDSELKLEPNADFAAVLKAMTGHVIAKGETVGTYQTK